MFLSLHRLLHSTRLRRKKRHADDRCLCAWFPFSCAPWNNITAHRIRTTLFQHQKNSRYSWTRSDCFCVIFVRCWFLFFIINIIIVSSSKDDVLVRIPKICSVVLCVCVCMSVLVRMCTTTQSMQLHLRKIRAQSMWVVKETQRPQGKLNCCIRLLLSDFTEMKWAYCTRCAPSQLSIPLFCFFFSFKPKF